MKSKNAGVVVWLTLSLHLSAAAVCAAPAPAISSLRVVSVGSTHHQAAHGVFYETIPANQYGTVRDHGGTELRVVTEQYGYDAVSSGTLNGVSCRLAQTDQLKRGTTVVGFRHLWDCSGEQQGRFVTTAVSVGSSRQWSTWIDIK